MKHKGYKDQILAVDLSQGKIERRSLDESMVEKYIREL